jgi:hypothetical protein
MGQRFHHLESSSASTSHDSFHPARGKNGGRVIVLRAKPA